uniref:Uncharacterized protein n=1 Tax=Glossina pallidipes TaxID=7398 RepID=A0A1B0AIB4_GLOPL
MTPFLSFGDSFKVLKSKLAASQNRCGLNKLTWEKENYLLSNFESNNIGILLSLTVPPNFLILASQYEE